MKRQIYDFLVNTRTNGAKWACSLRTAASTTGKSRVYRFSFSTVR